jgi:hypothetical protein
MFVHDHDTVKKEQSETTIWRMRAEMAKITCASAPDGSQKRASLEQNTRDSLTRGRVTRSRLCGGRATNLERAPQSRPCGVWRHGWILLFMTGYRASGRRGDLKITARKPTALVNCSEAATSQVTFRPPPH